MDADDPRTLAAASRRPWYRLLYVQVLVAVAVGVALGALAPGTAVAMAPLGTAFVNLVKMMIAPVIFVTVVHGIATMGDLTRVGRVGVKTILYFEVVSTVALAIGLVVAELVHPGTGFDIDPKTLDTSDVAGFIAKAKADSVIAHLLAIIPDSFATPFASGELLPMLLVAILSGIVLSRMGAVGERVSEGIDAAGKVFFRIIGLIVTLAPVGAFGAIAFTVGKYGLSSLVYLGWLIGTFYATSLLFVFVVLGLVARASGFSIWRFVVYIKDELLIVLGTSSSETVLPNMIRKMQALGASKPVVGLVIPTGYSFNLDGTNIYMTLSVLFLAQATNTHLSLGQELYILLIAALTSKGASGVTGAGFITLAATLQVVPDIPIASIAVIFGIDKFMSECRALTNLVGNGVATLVISRWEGELDRDKLHAALARPVAVGDAVEAQIA